MPIDGQIPLSGRGVGPLMGANDVMQQIQQAQMQRQQAAALEEQRRALAEQRQQQTAKLTQENADRTATGQAIQQGGGVRAQTLAWAVANAPNTVPTLTEFFDKADEKAGTIKAARLKVQNDEADYLGDLADGVLKHGGTPEALKTALSYAVEQFPDYADSAQKIAAQLKDAQPAQVVAFLEHVRDQAPSRRVKSTGPQVVSGNLVSDTGKVLYTAPEKVETPKAGTFEDFLTSYAQSKGRTVAQLSPPDKLRAKSQWDAAGRAPAGDGSKFWVMRDGKPLRVSDAEYRPGDTPASTREQGRPVTSGDANRIADLDTSLNDLRVLATTLGTTGAGSKVGAMLPNVVSEYTGWGLDSKARQGTIDRVKQVIGKALEGGVLRKEDEIKYEKILPTIGDPPEVAKAKLTGLEEALVLRRQTTLDALGDAGYDTGKFTTRGAPAKADDGLTVTTPDGQTFSFKTKADADVFKKRAGIQ